MDILLALMLGTGFGFVLQKVGVTDTVNIRNMLTLTRLNIMKSILFGIGGSCFLLFLMLALGAVNPAHFSVKETYAGVIVGGLIFGVGWALACYCPGTAVAALGEGSKKALVFVLGGLVGALLLTLSYGYLSQTFLFASLGGSLTLANSGNDKYGFIVDASPLLVAGIVSAVFILIACVLPPDKGD